VLFRLRLQEKIAGRRLPDELLDPLRDVRVGFIGSGNFSWQWKPDVTLSGGVKFTQQVSSHSDLDWNGFNLIPRNLFQHEILLGGALGCADYPLYCGSDRLGSLCSA
jgi:hypothetical protein